VSAERDLRAAQWQDVVESRSAARFELARPASGYVAVFGEARFGAGRRAFTLSTNLAVVAAAAERPYGTEPRGQAGVCGDLAATPVQRVP
jgi:hypothetical protein